MGFENPGLVTVLVLILSACMLIQTAFVVLLSLQLARRLRDSCEPLQSLAERAGEALEQAGGMLDSVREKTAVLPDFQASLKSRLPLAVEQVRRVDDAAARQIDLLRYQVQRAGAVVDGAVSRVSRRTFQLHQASQHAPVGAATLFQAGLRAVLSLFSKQDTSPPSHSGDIQDFI